MKRYLLFALAICCCLFCSCTNTQSGDVYASYVYGKTNNACSVAIEKNWWLGVSTQDPSAPETITVTFEGETYEGAYYNSLRRNLNRDIFNNYKTAESTKIAVNPAQNNKVYGVHKDYSDEMVMLPDVDDPYTYALNAAKEFASRYVTLDDYTTTLSQQTNTITRTIDGVEYELKEYTFRFVKYHDGYPTNDDVFIQMTSKGNWRSFSLGDIGIFDHLPENVVDTEKLDRSIAEKVDTLFEDRDDFRDYEIYQQTLAYTPEGQLALVSYLWIHFEEYSTGIDLITILDDASVQETSVESSF